MAAVNYAPHGSSSIPPRAAGYQAPVPVSNAPAGTFAPGTKVQVGSHRVVIEKYLSEGGFAHVYVVRVPTGDGKHEVAVLKRVAVPDKDSLASMRTEVETMKKLKGHKHIVMYMDSHASQLKGGGYEVFLLMEFCAGGGLIDFMNTRLQNRLTEPEILKIFGDVSEGVATMHYLRPPLLHRDLKVENVLISKPPTSSSGVVYKLCDFGSTAPPRPAAASASEGRLIEEDVQRHTTLQYRSPEMIDVWRKQPIDEKSDIWALGVLLYKLCYYTTPFEEVGQMAILNASFKYPHHPPFSDKLKKLIGSMLQENPKNRPNIYQIVSRVSSMRGTSVPIKDIYSERSQSEARRNQQLPPTSPNVASPPPAAGISYAPPQQQQQSLPDITPMRRGRPTSTTPAAAAHAVRQDKPSPTVTKGDPFAALDSTSMQVRAGAVDQLSAKFPSLDDFSIAHTKGSSFPFSESPASRATGRLNERVTNALADDAFAQTKTAEASRVKPTDAAVFSTATSSRKTAPEEPPKRTVAREPPVIQEPTPTRPGYTSTGTMTSPSPPAVVTKNLPALSKTPIWKVPLHGRSSSQPRATAASQSLGRSGLSAQQDNMTTRSRSPLATESTQQPANSSRPSLEGRRPSEFTTDDPVTRTKSASSRSRPMSTAPHVNSNLEYLRTHERESSSYKKRPSLEMRRSSREQVTEAYDAQDETAIENDTDYLRSVEDSAKSSRRSSSQKKRSSLPSLSLSGTRNALAGRFGDALKKFESNHEDDRKGSSTQHRTRTPSPAQDARHDERALLSPISGSEAMGSPPSTRTEFADLDETEDMPPEVRRELERLRLSQEEQRVADAAAEYRNRPSGVGKATKASTIQKRVQTLLDERAQSPVKKTASGYGQYTELCPSDGSLSGAGSELAPTAAQLPFASSAPRDQQQQQQRRQQQQQQQQQAGNGLEPQDMPVPPASAPPAQSRATTRPATRPKPNALRTGGGAVGGVSGPSPSPTVTARLAAPTSRKPVNPASTQQSRLAALLARDQEGVAAPGAGSSTGDTSSVDESPVTFSATSNGPGDWEADFSRRFPSLSGIEMVETEISRAEDLEEKRGIRVRDV